MSSQQRRISIAGENSLIVYFDDNPTAAIASQIAQTASQLRETIGQVLVDLVPSYGSLPVSYTHLTLPTTPYV